MEANKILSANILDLIFDDRNKEYGAYDLRVTYPQRVKRSLIIVFLITAVVLSGAILASSVKPGPVKDPIGRTIVIDALPPDEDKPIPPPPPPKSETPAAKTEKLTALIKMVKEQVDPLPTQEDFKTAEVGTSRTDGPEDKGIEPAIDPNDGKGIIETKNKQEPEIIFTTVEVDAKFDGDWAKFLFTNLNATVAVDNGAPVGRYRVQIQFVVDREGNVSDIKALTNHGYGMEQEAIRVIKKAKKWIPANQNGRAVKAYRVQPITFEVMEG